MQRVAAQEAWLNEQSRRPVDSWLQSCGGREISLDNFEVTANASELTQVQTDRSLIVIDPRSSQWQKLSTDLPNNTDLLILDKERSGTDQFKEIISEATSVEPYAKILLIASTDGDDLSFGSQNLTAADLSEQISLIRRSDLSNIDSQVSLFAASSFNPQAITVDVTSESSDLEQYARDLIEASINSAAFSSAIGAAFSATKHALIESFARDFVDGLRSPLLVGRTLKWSILVSTVLTWLAKIRF